jgi:Transmembrane protein 131-like N-terminal
MKYLSFWIALLVIARSVAILEFFPSDFIEFVNCPVLIPKQKLFTITNIYDREVHINSVTSDSSNFHTVMFQPALLLPLQAMNIQILFLPYYTETVHSILQINTSEGDIQYHAKGRALPNPYKLHPYLGQRVQHGSVPYEHSVVIFNPHDEALYIQEIFTTDDFLSLKGGPTTDFDETGEMINHNSTSVVSSQLWTIDPGFEKEIVVLSMAASTTGTFSGYVHIRTSRDSILLPVELQVLDNINPLRAREDSIDFGILTGSGQKSFADLWLQNTGSTDLKILDIGIERPDSLLKIIPMARTVVAEEGTEFLVAQLVYTANVITDHKEKSVPKGKNSILVYTDNLDPVNSVLEVPFQVSVLLGGIVLDDVRKEGEMQSAFILPHLEEDLVNVKPTRGKSKSKTAEKKGTTKEFYLTNSFPLPIRLLTVSTVSCSDIFSLSASFLQNSVTSNGSSSSFLVSKTMKSTRRGRKDHGSSLPEGEGSPDSDVEVESFHPSSVAQSGHQWPPISVTFRGKLPSNKTKSGEFTSEVGALPPASSQHTPDGTPFVPFTCWLEIFSNKSSHRFPLYVVDGGVRLSFMDAVRKINLHLSIYMPHNDRTDLVFYHVIVIPHCFSISHFEIVLKHCSRFLLPKTRVVQRAQSSLRNPLKLSLLGKILRSISWFLTVQGPCTRST